MTRIKVFIWFSVWLFAFWKRVFVANVCVCEAAQSKATLSPIMIIIVAVVVMEVLLLLLLLLMVAFTYISVLYVP